MARAYGLDLRRRVVEAIDGGLLRVLSAEFGGAPISSGSFWTRFGTDSVVLHN